MSQQELLAVGFKMLLSLGLVLLVFGGVVLLLKKISYGPAALMRKNRAFKAKPIEILGAQSLGPGRQLFLIRALNQKLLIGVTQQSVSKIVELREEDDAADAESFDEVFEEKADQKATSSSRGREIARV